MSKSHRDDVFCEPPALHVPYMIDGPGNCEHGARRNKPSSTFQSSTLQDQLAPKGAKKARANCLDPIDLSSSSQQVESSLAVVKLKQHQHSISFSVNILLQYLETRTSLLAHSQPFILRRAQLSNHCPRASSPPYADDSLAMEGPANIEAFDELYLNSIPALGYPCWFIIS